MNVGRGTWHRLAGILFLAAVALAGYLISSQRLQGLGFPLDDAWIHQTYARNLIRLGQWAFVPGRPSAGSTSPLWAILETPAALLRIGPVAWSALLGWLTLAFTAWVGGTWIVRETGRPGKWLWVAVIGLVFEWHLVWASLSGMETLLLGGSALGLLWGMRARPQRGFLWGVLVGLTVWIRPDGLTLSLAYAWIIVLGDADLGTSLRRLAVFSVGVAALAVPYLGFNYALSGDIWPNTFYAKQAEYAVLRQLPWLTRLGRELAQPFVGPGAVLVPGIVLWVVDKVRGRRWAELAPLLWAMAYLAAYAARLPVIYQHGRYAIPTVPTLVVLGMLGTLGWLDLSSQRAWRRIVSRTWLATWLLVTGAFWVIGGNAYARDVAVINTEMVDTSNWIRQHTPPGSVIAAHDIGALGYFGDRPILDLAGLVNPEVIPFIRDEAHLADYLQSRGADYLMTFPGWYPSLTEGRTPIYRSRGGYSPELGGENMAIYFWPH
jgi:hypothetical protein